GRWSAAGRRSGPAPPGPRPAKDKGQRTKDKGRTRLPERLSFVLWPLALKKWCRTSRRPPGGGCARGVVGRGRGGGGALSLTRQCGERFPPWYASLRCASAGGRREWGDEPAGRSS